ncbi:zinc finger MYM-type protein 1-like [Sycon ciliatum]|uniref:zinc finger MYM-type protein 1-like n=1 Tax=Sycon ciliatum TaxID=27933 RepID=UPI0031F60110
MWQDIHLAGGRHCQSGAREAESAIEGLAFISKGFKNWKDATEGFRRHEKSLCHIDAVQVMLVLPQTVPDVGEALRQAHAKEKALNRRMFVRILENMKFLGRQGLPLRGHDDAESNFMQLLQLQKLHTPELRAWLERRVDKYCSPEIQNEILQLMSHSILRNVAKSIHTAEVFSVMADECADVSNKEQLALCFRWVDQELEAHEDFVGLCQIDNISADTIVAAIRDCMLRLNLQVNRCRGQCYDGASNMAGHRSGVAKQLGDEEPRALFVHCYGHSLNLAMCDTIKTTVLTRDSLHVTSELIMRGKSLQSILDNYLVLQELWDEVLAGSVDPDVRARVIGVKAQMETFNFFFGISLARLVLAHGDNLSVSLQSSTMSAAEAQKIARLTVDTITKMRTENSFSMFWEATVAKRHQFDVSEPQLPRKRKRPQRYEGGDEPAYHPSSPEGHYRQLYYEVLDSAKSSIQTRFNQKGFAIYTQMENLLLKSAKGVDATDEFKAVTELYGEDLDSNLLLTQFSLLQTQLTSDDDVTFKSVLKFLRGYSTSQRQLLSEVVKLVRLILVSPATNAMSVRSFSAMRRIKTYLRSTMGQSRLNSVMLLHTHKDRTDALSVVELGNAFVDVTGSDHRRSIFGTFTDADLAA